MRDNRGKMYFSQAALMAYQTCPLKFRYHYLDGLNWLAARQHDNQVERMLGEHFHVLAQRYFQGVGLAELRRVIPPGPLSGWLDKLQVRFPLQQAVAYYPEQEIRVELNKTRLTAKYDLLAVYPDGRIIIYDWKTRTTPFVKGIRSLQAQVYAMVLCAAAPFGTIRPEAITMIFWNPRFPGDEQVWSYNESLYRQDQAELTGLISQITHMAYENFPGIKSEDGTILQPCQQCDYANICLTAGQAVLNSSLGLEPDFSWDDIEEIAYEEE